MVIASEKITQKYLIERPIVVDIYCRVSTDDQENNTSLEEQERCGREYCKEHGLIVGEVWKETYSGFVYRERAKLAKMRRRYQEGKIQGVVFRTLDRLSRKQEHVAILLEEMEYYDVDIHCIKEKIDDTPMGKIARMVLAFVAEMEREKILDRTTTGRINKAKEGKAPPVGTVPYGRRWVYNDKGEHDHIELVEEQAEVLRKAGQQYADGISLNSIVAKLNADGIPSATGGIWHNGSLLRLLTDPRITGRNLKAFDSRWKSDKVKNKLDAVDLPDDTYPQIITPELYERIIARTEYNRDASPRNSAEPEQFLLRGGIARCKYCGNAMGTYICRRPNRKNQYLYRCNTKHADCYQHAANATALDKEVWEMASLAADYQPLIEQSIALAAKHDLALIDLASVERAIKTCQGRIENYEDDLADPNLRGDTRAGVRQLLNAQYKIMEDLQTELAKLMAHAIDTEKQKAVYARLLEWCHKARHEREELTYIERRDFLNVLGMTVFVGKRPDRYHELDWDAKLRLPELESILHDADFCNSLSHEQA